MLTPSVMIPGEESRSLFRRMLDGFVQRARFPIFGSRARLRRREEALGRIETHYRSFIDEAPIGIFRTTADGRFLSANHKLARIFGYTCPEEIMASVTDLGWQVYVDSADREALLRRAVDTSLVKNAEVRIRRRDGRIGWASISLRPVRDDQGCVYHYDGFLTDVTERKEAQEALAASESMLRHIVRWVRDIIYRLDDQGRILFISHSVTRLGYQENELIGESIFELVGSDDKERCRRRLDERRTGRRRTTGLEIRLQRKPGALFSCDEDEPVFRLEAEGLYEARKDGLRFVGTIGIARDISRRKAVEKRLQRSLVEKQLLLRELQHRVKNNLQVLSSLLELSTSQVRSEEAVAICREMQGHIRCVALIHSLLSKPGARDTVDMGEFVRTLFDSVKGLYSRSRIVPVFVLDDVHLHLDKALPCGMLLNELFSNAFKHAFFEGESGELRVSMVRAGGGRVRLEVEDNGVGLPLSEEREGNRSMGMRLMSSLVSQLHGEFEISGANGTAARIDFPCEPPRDRLTPGVEA